ncbi:MAG: thioredoxin [candidate division WOR-3 bacterium]|nr:thioredoxin [candidate division WOR-3 bacterium]
MSKHLNEKEFDSAISEKGNIVVDFWAQWCMPCKAIEPILNEAEKDLDIKVYKLNVDDYPEIAQRFNIFSIPTLLCFKDGKLVGKVVGAMPKQKLYKKLMEIFQIEGELR